MKDHRQFVHLSPGFECGIMEEKSKGAVHYAVCQEEYLEDVFVLFHSGRPDGFRGHSLSVSDVVEVEDAASMTPGFYFCDSVGFKEIPFQPELASDVVIRPPTIQVVLVEPGKLARIAEVGITLESMQ